ncbi:MAG: hypothetical protein P8M20_05230, partial [Planctomycetaceae bacterium]|nr:hypothetical protein [Planctomycetaceae bacterium]
PGTGVVGQSLSAEIDFGDCTSWRATLRGFVRKNLINSCLASEGKSAMHDASCRCPSFLKWIEFSVAA